MTGKKNNNTSQEKDSTKAADMQSDANAQLKKTETADTKNSPSTAEAKTAGTKAAETKKVTPEKTKTKKSATGILLFLLLIILLALGAGGYFAWMQWQNYQSEQSQRLQTLESALAEQVGQVQSLNSQQSEQVSDQANLYQQIRDSQTAIEQRLDSHTQRLRELAGTSRDDWLLAEARYLLRLANQRLLVERNTEGPAALLSSADSILESVDDASILPVRNAIANEIIALKLAKTVDRQGLYLQLAALKNQIQALPLVPFRPQNDKESSNITSTESTNTLDADSSDTPTPWYHTIWNSVRNAFSGLDRFVQIRHHNEAPELLVSENQQLQIINQLSLMFEQAQFALLHEEEMIFRSSLAEAKNSWDLYYRHYDEYEVIRDEINRLQQTTIIQNLPDISRSSTLLSDFIERFHTLNAETQKPAATTDESKTQNTEETTTEKQEEPQS